MFQSESTYNCHFLPAYLEMVSNIFLADETSNPKKGILAQNGEKKKQKPSEFLFLHVSSSVTNWKLWF